MAITIASRLISPEAGAKNTISSGIAFSTWTSSRQKSRAVKTLRECDCAGGVIDVRVCHQYLGETRTGERHLQRGKMPGIARSGVDERRHASGNEPRPVTRAGHRTGVERVNGYRFHAELRRRE